MGVGGRNIVVKVELSPYSDSILVLTADAVSPWEAVGSPPESILPTPTLTLTILEAATIFRITLFFMT